MSAPDQITLHRTADCWIARHHGSIAREVAELFGSPDLPTAFTAAAPADVVLSRIRALNPGILVQLAT